MKFWNHQKFQPLRQWSVKLRQLLMTFLSSSYERLKSFVKQRHIAWQKFWRATAERWPWRVLIAAWHDFEDRWSIPYISARMTFAIIFSTFATTWLLDKADAFMFLESRVAEPTGFFARQYAGMAPPVSPRLKIFAVDDKTVANLKRGDLDLTEWSKVFAALDRQNPRVIIVDKLFDMPSRLAEQGEAFTATMKALKTPVIIGSFVSHTAIEDRPEIQAHDVRLPGAIDNSTIDGHELAQRLTKLPIETGFAYGAPEALRVAFGGFGHLVYRGDGRIGAMLHYNTGHVLPHASMYAASAINIENGLLTLDSGRVPLDQNGRVIVNFPHLEQLKAKSYSAKALFSRAFKGGTIDVVKEDDVVLILPAMFTGTTDFAATPIGFIQGGYVIATMVNSVITGKWLTSTSASDLLLYLAGAIGLGIGLSTWASRFWLMLMAANLLLLSSGLGAFIMLSLVIPWLPALAALNTGALMVFAERTRVAKVLADEIAKELETSKIVQAAFLPHQNLEVPALRVRGFYQSASAVSGDYWAYWPEKNGVAYVMIGDAVGHGTPAALITAMAYAVTALLENDSDHLNDDIGRRHLSPAKILERLNYVIVQSMGLASTMTFFVIAIDYTQNCITYASAGHPFPYVFPPRGVELKGKAAATGFETLSSVGPVLGLTDKPVYKESTRPITPGETILMYTDGLIENQGRDKQVWTRKQIGKTAVTLLEEGKPLLEEIVGMAAKRFAGAPLDDDYTIVAIEIGEKKAEEEIAS